MLQRIDNQFGAFGGETSVGQRRLTVNEETLSLLGAVRSSEQGLQADTDVINFLLSLYFMKCADGKEKPWPSCPRCNSILKLVCCSCEKSETPTQRTLSQDPTQNIPSLKAPPAPAAPPARKRLSKNNSCPLKDKCTCCCKQNKCKPATNLTKAVKPDNCGFGSSGSVPLEGPTTSSGSLLSNSTSEGEDSDDSSEDSDSNEDSDEAFQFCDVPLIDSSNNDSLKKFPCDSCSKRFSQAAYLTRHKWKYHSPKEYKECKICKLECATVKGLRKHVITHKKEIPNLCIHCCQAFATGQELKEHCVVCSCRPLHSCELCDKVFTQKYFLDEHMSKHTGHTPYICEFCSQSFGSSNGLSRHRSIHTGKTQCNICGKIFAHLSGLKAHKVIHTGQRPHACSSCGKTFTQESNLKTHMLTHTGQKPHRCDQCPKAFAQAISLRRHKLIHTGEKSHICHLCGTSFARSSTLHAHMLTHTGQKKHVCTVCNKGFTQAVALKMHMSTHTGVTENVCNICGKSFAWPKSLKNHLFSRHGIGGDNETEIQKAAPAHHPLENLTRLTPVRSESVDSHLAFFHNVSPTGNVPWAT